MSLKSIDYDGNPNRSRRFRMYDLLIDDAFEFNTTLSNDTSPVGFPINSYNMTAYREETIPFAMNFIGGTTGPAVVVNFQFLRFGNNVFMSWLPFTMPDMATNQKWIRSATAIPNRYLPPLANRNIEYGIAWTFIPILNNVAPNLSVTAYALKVFDNGLIEISTVTDTPPVSPAVIRVPTSFLQWKL